MNLQLEDIKEKALTLSDAEREALAHDLLDSLPTTDSVVTSADIAEWDRRLTELKNGSVAGLSLESFRREVGRI